MSRAERLDKLAPWLVAACAAAAFLPALRCGFVDFDDALNLVGNPRYRGLGLSQLRWIFSLPVGVHYNPLTWLSYALDYSLWGMNPAGYHLANVCLHALDAALAYLFFRRLLADVRSAAFAALFFALHPLRAESVAWIAQRGDVLSTAFYLGSLILYLDGRLAASCALFAGGLLSKSTGLLLPLVFVVLDAYPSRRPRPWKEKLPFVAVAAAACALAFFRHQEGTVASAREFTPAFRLAQAAFGLIFYPLKTLWPRPLIPLYGLPAPMDAWRPEFLWRAAAGAAVTAALFLSRRRLPAAFSAWACYILAALPALGLVKFGPHLAAERYSYFSCLPFAALAGAAFSSGLRRAPRASAFAAAGFFLLLAALSWRQTLTWRDSESLWTHACAADPAQYYAQNFLSLIRARQGRWREAEILCRKALIINPAYAAAHNNMGRLLTRQGKLDAALFHLRKAAALSPGHAVVHFNIGAALESAGRLEEAADEYRAELAVDPASGAARRALARLGR